jgi:hypothetical protein
MKNCNSCTKLQVCWVNTTEDLENITSKFMDKNMEDNIDKKTEYFDKQLDLLAEYCYFYDEQ